MQKQRTLLQKHGTKPPRGKRQQPGSASRNKKVRAAILLVIAAALIYLVYRVTQSHEWAEFRSDRFWRNLAAIRLPYLLLAVAFVFCSYFFRSLRWQRFLRPLKSASVTNIFVSTVIGFSAVSLVGRPGEL